MNQFPCLIRTSTPGGEARFALGELFVDSYLAFVAGRCRPNTLRAVAHDLKTFFAVIDKDPVDVAAADIFDFVADQRGDRSVVRISDGESGLSGSHDRPAAFLDLGSVRVSPCTRGHAGRAIAIIDNGGFGCVDVGS